MIATVADDNVQVWDLASGAELSGPVKDGALGPTSAVISSNGKMLATVNGASAIMTQIVTGQRLGVALPVEGGMVEVAAFSPDSTLLAVGGAGGFVRIWDTADHHQVGVFQAGTSQVAALAFNPAGNTLAIANQAGQVLLWDVATWHQIGTPAVIGDLKNVFVAGTAISPGGQIAAIGANTGAAWLWNITHPRQLRYLPPAETAGSATIIGGAVAFSPFRKLLAVAQNNGTIQLWDIANHRAVGILHPGSAYASQLAFSPNGGTLAVLSPSNVVLVNVRTGRPVGPHIALATGPRSGLQTMAFSHDGKILVTATPYMVQLWDISRHRELSSFRIANSNTPLNQFGPLALSPDGRLMAADTLSTRLWDTATGQQEGAPLDLATLAGGPTALAISPDGSFLAAAVGGTIGLWDISTHQQIGAPLTYASPMKDIPESLSFSSDGKTLIGFGMVAAWLWNVTLPENPLTTACSIAGRSLSSHEWNLYIPNVPFQKICG
jgi:WD40 repeat protein